jgi:hypothetical protein
MLSIIAASRRRFTPLSLSPALWLDASDANTLYDATTGGSLVAADGTVARWEDKSGNARHLTQGTLANRPQRKISVFNNRDILRFFGSGDLMAISGFSVSNPVTVFAVVFLSADFSSFRVAYGFGANVFAMGYNNSAELYAFSSTGITVARSRPTTLEILRVTSNVASSSIGANGSETTGSIAAHSTTTFGVGGNNSMQTYPSDFAELLVFPTALSTADRQAVERYLAAKWGITLA